jgi:hypothetical protein
MEENSKLVFEENNIAQIVFLFCNAANLKIGARILNYRKQFERVRERGSFSFSESRTGRWHKVRIVMLILGAAFLSWYSRQGANNPFAATKTLWLKGNESGCALVYTEGKSALTLLTFSSSGNKIFQNEIDGKISDRVLWQTVYPFSDSIHAILLTVDKTTALVCDSSVFSRSSKEARSQFKEKLDLLIIPSASGKTVKEMREIFRPRFAAVIPPCGVLAEARPQNIICIQGGESWEYGFKIRNGKLRVSE